MTGSQQARAPIRAASHPSMCAGVLLLATATGASAQSMQLQRQLSEVFRHHQALPATSRRHANRRNRFERMRDSWAEATQWSSSTTEIAMHPAYQAIIGMGTDALPMILRELRDRGGYWYWALKAISDEDPVPPLDRGDIPKMDAHWIRWGACKGLIQP